MNRTESKEVDAVLSGFFKSAMPNPWPKLAVEPAVASSLQPKSGGSLMHARLVLAASVLFLMFGFWGLSSQFKTDTSNGVEETSHIASKSGPNGLKPAPKTVKDLPR